MSFKNFLFKRGRLFSKVVKSSQIKSFLKRFRENYVSIHLIRVGRDNDVGYLAPNIMKKLPIVLALVLICHISGGKAR